MSDPKFVEWNADALAAAAEGNLEQAVELADKAADEGSLLGVALSTYLRSAQQQSVYENPAAFEAFIAGGGNIELYARTSVALSGGYPGVASLLDIGCGNGLALVRALQQSPAVPSHLELVEPGADLLAHCVDALQLTALPIQVTGWQMGLTDFLAAAPAGQRWDLAQSTFALQSIEPDMRLAGLTALAPRVDRIVIVEFDGSDERTASSRLLRTLARRYERGLAEYDETRELVAQGFLMPVLLGQLSIDTPRTNWEHPADEWRRQISQAGFRNVKIRPLADYWSAPAFMLAADGG